MLSRGLRNNNPGNIDYNPKIQWQGQVGIETDLPAGVKPRFIKFTSMEYGIRALCRLLQTYSTKYKIDTMREVVHRYAPPVENKTDRYVENVAKWSGLGPDTSLDFKSADTLKKLVPAIIRQENGVALGEEAVNKGIQLALK